MATTAYRPHGNPQQQPFGRQEWLDVLGMMVAPCLPLGRAGSMIQVPFLLVVLLVTPFYVGGLYVFSFYVREGLAGWWIVVVGWLLYLVGPTMSVSLAIFWWLRGLSCWLNDHDAPSCSNVEEEPRYGAGAVGCFFVVFVITLMTRHALMRQYATKTQRKACDSHCYACCVPWCALVSAMRIAREASALEQLQRDHEIPAYEA